MNMTNEGAIKYYDRKLTICESNIAMCQESDDVELQCALHVYVAENDRLKTVLSALRAQQAREHPQPLSLAQLRERDGGYYWMKDKRWDGSWRIYPVELWGREADRGVLSFFACGNERNLYRYQKDYGESWVLFACEPPAAGQNGEAQE